MLSPAVIDHPAPATKMTATDRFQATLAAPDPAATAAIARRLAPALVRGDVVALSGPLGAGKTAFARALIGARAAESGLEQPDVPSPTFTLLQTYDLPNGAVWHFDLYRLARPEDALELGFEEALAGGITLVEWPERLGTALPTRRIDVAFAYGASPEARTISVGAAGAAARRLAAVLA
jgi:tRNA threonylcarbamoyladenosine biosynthesis protein TsaE